MKLEILYNEKIDDDFEWDVKEFLGKKGFTLLKSEYDFEKDERKMFFNKKAKEVLRITDKDGNFKYEIDFQEISKEYRDKRLLQLQEIFPVKEYAYSSYEI